MSTTIQVTRGREWYDAGYGPHFVTVSGASAVEVYVGGSAPVGEVAVQRISRARPATVGALHLRTYLRSASITVQMTCQLSPAGTPPGYERAADGAMLDIAGRGVFGGIGYYQYPHTPADSDPVYRKAVTVGAADEFGSEGPWEFYEPVPHAGVWQPTGEAVVSADGRTLTLDGGAEGAVAEVSWSSPFQDVSDWIEIEIEVTGGGVSLVAGGVTAPVTGTLVAVARYQSAGYGLWYSDGAWHTGDMAPPDYVAAELAVAAGAAVSMRVRHRHERTLTPPWGV